MLHSIFPLFKLVRHLLVRFTFTLSSLVSILCSLSPFLATLTLLVTLPIKLDPATNLLQPCMFPCDLAMKLLDLIKLVEYF